MDVDAVDFHIFICADQNVLGSADNPGFHQIGPGGIYLDHHIRGFDFKVFAVNQKKYLKSWTYLVKTSESVILFVEVQS